MRNDFAMAEIESWAEMPKLEDRPKHSVRHRMTDRRERFYKRYGLLIIGACLFTLYTLVLSWSVHALTVRDVRKEMAIEYCAQLEQYKKEQAEAVQASYFQSGEASREAAINQAVDAVARVISTMTTDSQKKTMACNILARVMSPNYPNSFEEVISQPNQWMFYDEANKFTAHDREIADSIVRPYFEESIVPNGLTGDYVYGSWSATDYVLRNTWEYGPGTLTWRYQ